MHCHAKALRAGNAALGLWLRCGSYAAQHLTDGFIPHEVAALYGPASQRKKLVEVGMWDVAPSGYQMHDFGEYNPTSEQVRAERWASAERQRRGRQKAAAERATHRDGDPPGGDRHGVTADEVTDDSHQASRVSRPDPTRPDLQVLVAPDESGEPETKKKRPPDPIWDAMLDACHIDTEEITAPARGAYNKAAKDLRGVGATPEQIRARALVADQKWDPGMLNPTALARRWSELNGTPTQARRFEQ